MSEYKRFISYIYAYDRGIKSKNVGFAKIESRNGQCKLLVNLKGAYAASGKEQEIFLFRRKGEQIVGTRMGSFIIRNGMGEFRDYADAANIKKSGYSLEEMNGLFIRNREDDGHVYASGWDDHILNVNLFQPENENAAEIFPEEEVKPSETIKAPGEVKPSEIIKTLEEVKPSETIKVPEEVKSLEVQKKEESIREKVMEVQKEKETERKPVLSIGEPDIYRKEEPLHAAELYQNKKEARTVEIQDLEKQGNTEYDSLWECLMGQFPKVVAFEDEPQIICLKIDLKDIELLPKKYWILGNNSFLLHGFYNFRYLILAKLGEKEHMLGIPGMYHNNERFMAAMFGFDHFKPVKSYKQLTGQFGYWYQLITL